MGRGARGDLDRRFEGREVLDELLSLAGSALDSQEVLARFVAGLGDQASPSEVFPTLFDEEPRFPDPELARRLYANLFGLWDLAETGDRVVLEPTRGERRKRQKPVPPPPYAPGAPDGLYVEGAWRYLEAAQQGDARTYERLVHAFENRHDALLQRLDARGLSDDAYATARYLLFELFAMLELGRAPGHRVQAPAAVPGALRTYVDEALFEAEHDEDTPLTAAELEAVRAEVERGLTELWADIRS